MTFMTTIAVLLVVMGLEFCVAGEGALATIGEEITRDHRGRSGTLRGEFWVELIVLFRCCSTRGNGVGVRVSGMGKDGGSIDVGDGRGERWIVSVSFGHACLILTRIGDPSSCRCRVE